MKMEIDFYEIHDGDILIAQRLSLGHALIFLKALLQEYYNDTGVAYTIRRMPKTEGECCREDYNG